MGLTFCYGIVDMLKESWQGNFSEKSFLMLGKQTIFDLSKFDIFAAAKKLDVKLDYKLLRSKNFDGGGWTATPFSAP